LKKISLATLCLVACSFSCFAQKQWILARQELLFHDPPFLQCHASTIVELSSGELMAAWFAGTREGAKDVCIWSSTGKGSSWTKPVVLACGEITDTLRYPCWNPVLFKSSTGKLFLFYKVGPSPQQWWGMMRSSADEGKTWSVAVKLPEGMLGPIKNKPYQLPDGSILAPSSEETKTKWSVHLERSADDGNTWTKILIDTSDFDVIQPSILNYGHGKLQILCRSKQGAVVQAWSPDNGQTWGKLSRTELLNPNSGTDAVTLKDGRQLIVYNPDLPGKEWNNGRAKLHVAISADSTHWKDILRLENGTKEEFSYPAVIQAKDGSVHVTYTYDRKNIKHVVIKEK
jgi:predicted neuraminidase